MGPLQMMLNLNTTFLLSLLFQYFSLAIFSSKSGLFLFFVPLGLIIRSIPYLRGFGGALASIGVGFYILYPMFLAIIGLTLPPIVLYENNALFGAYQKNGLNYIVQKEHSITGTAFSYYNSMPDFEDWGNGMLKAAAVESPSDPECEGASKCFYTANLAPLFELTALNFIRAILLPSAGLIVIVSFVRDLSAIFGEEVEASRLVQMV
jgi:hypothetical protein